MHTFTIEDVPALIDALITFIGEERIKRSIASWRNSTQLARPIERVRRRAGAFHWWPGFDSYLTDKGVRVPPSKQMFLLAKDAIKVLDVVATMPEPLKKQLASALGDLRNAPARLFEVSMAHHFMDFGYHIQWVEESGKGIPEFVAVAPGIEFEVECKYMSVDAGRLVGRDEFARFGAAIEAQLRKRRAMGEIRVSLNGRLPTDAAEVKRIAALIGGAACAAGYSVEVDLSPWGTADTRLAPADDAVIDWEVIDANMRAARPPQGHAFAHAEECNNRPVNPIILTLHSLERDIYVRTMYDTMKEAARRQLSGQRPGLLCIHIPEIRDFSGLIDESDLRAMTAHFFSKSEHTHVYAVAYSSDTRILEEPTGYRFTADVLAYRNAECRYPEALQFRLFNHETVPPAPEGVKLAASMRFDDED